MGAWETFAIALILVFLMKGVALLNGVAGSQWHYSSSDGGVETVVVTLAFLQDHLVALC